MADDFAPGFPQPGAADPAEAEALRLDIEGFEGPLDLLLTLARSQKVDLRRISILQLAEQYLRFVAEARRLRIELAADWLVMAAWLAFLKSRLLLPAAPADGGPSGEEMAARLARQLERLEAIRRAAERLMARDQLGRDFFARGEPEAPEDARRTAWGATLADLLKAYAAVRTREAYQPLHMRRAPVYTLEMAFERLRAALPGMRDWATLSLFLPHEWIDTPERRRSAIASTFVAALELARRGEAELRQEAPFAPLHLRPRKP